MRKTLAAAALCAAIVALGAAQTPPPLDTAVGVAAIPDAVETWLDRREQAADAAWSLVPGTAKRIRWHTPDVKTPCSIVYVHGFSATRAEIAPTTERVAELLGANLFETRLSGHGRREQALVGTDAEAWLTDAAEAIAIGAAIGDRVVVIGTSTGATLALALARHPVMEHVSALVMLSPNFAPASPGAAWLTRPFGPQIGRLVSGPTRSWTPHNPAQARYWTTSYPIEAAVELMRVVDGANAVLPVELGADLLVVMSPDDRVVLPAATRKAYRAIGAPRKNLVEMHAEDPSAHILGGDILSPGTTESLAGLIADFVVGDAQEASASRCSRTGPAPPSASMMIRSPGADAASAASRDSTSSS